jgi:hypothetical protein
MMTIGNFDGHPDKECGEHRTTGARAWCHGCSEWCYPDGPCRGCELPQLRNRLAKIEQLVSDEEGQTWADPRLTPHFVRKLRVALGAAPERCES